MSNQLAPHDLQEAVAKVEAGLETLKRASLSRDADISAGAREDIAILLLEIVQARDEAGTAHARALKPGDVAGFTDRGGLRYQGRVQKVNRTRLVLVAAKGPSTSDEDRFAAKYPYGGVTVPFSMLD